ncbi:hypothetical protein [Bacillus sp. USDA818B3_A]|uniref:hypothetical protein n=1 Tax=Bacillus sp. USDA818B3_A TaxID=2698834 RepID=UPI00136CBD07|nr:hypothetical protein [Bacillus sp. USDA818B3_A]
MSYTGLNYTILCLAFVINGLGSFFIVKKNVYRYGMVLIISLIVTSGLCLLFYAMDFYRFVLPLPAVLPVVAISFSFLALFIIRYRPRDKTFPFFFITLTLVFTIEVFLKDYAGFIRFKNGWDYWDSYSLYWVFARLFNYVGVYLVPYHFRHPVKSDTKTYWGLFFLMVVYSVFGVYLLNQIGTEDY